jgi:hypothetical protein
MTPAKDDTYRAFLDFVGNDLQRERHQANRRMLSVFLWCFLAPAFVVAALQIMIKVHVLPRGMKTDWMILVFPVLYSLYILGTEFAVGIPAMFRRGGLATSLLQSVKDHEWRKEVSGGMKKAFPDYDDDQWKWISACFRIDLDNIRYRARYLTALAGAVFFLIMQGIDAIGTNEDKVAWIKGPGGAWYESGMSDLGQFVGLGLFLMLLYVSGHQTHHSLARYHDCVELVRAKPKS